MLHLKLARIAGVTAALAAVPAAASFAQSPNPAPTPPNVTQPSPMPNPAPMPPAAQKTKPADTALGNAKAMVGLTAFSSDGSKMGSVQSVSASPDGSIKAIYLKTGGFLGFGGKLVLIPEGKFTKSGEAIQLGMTADEVSKLPEVKEQS